MVHNLWTKIFVIRNVENIKILTFEIINENKNLWAIFLTQAYPWSRTNLASRCISNSLSKESWNHKLGLCSDETWNKLLLKLVFTGQRTFVVYICRAVRWFLVKHLVISRCKLKFRNSLINYISMKPSIGRTGRLALVVRMAHFSRLKGLRDRLHNSRPPWLLTMRRDTRGLNFQKLPQKNSLWKTPFAEFVGSKAKDVSELWTRTVKLLISVQ